jgi:hypothetical protein
MFSDVLVAAAMRFAVERYRELSPTLEQRVEDRTAELRKANEEIMAMYEHGGIMLGHLNPEGVVVDANRAGVEDLGFAPADITILGVPMVVAPLVRSRGLHPRES